MKNIKVVDRAGKSCGCEYTADGRGQEIMTKVCQEHESEFIVRHASAVASCSHANHDLVT